MRQDFYLAHHKEGILVEHAPADPRDGRWEIDRPVYRVYFWRPDGGACREYELREAADVGEVLEWARTFPQTEPGLSDWVPEVAVTHRDRVAGLGLIRLMGGRPGQTGSSAAIRF